MKKNLVRMLIVLSIIVVVVLGFIVLSEWGHKEMRVRSSIEYLHNPKDSEGEIEYIIRLDDKRLMIPLIDILDNEKLGVYMRSAAIQGIWILYQHYPDKKVINILRNKYEKINNETIRAQAIGAIISLDDSSNNTELISIEKDLVQKKYCLAAVSYVDRATLIELLNNGDKRISCDALWLCINNNVEVNLAKQKEICFGYLNEINKYTINNYWEYEKLNLIEDEAIKILEKMKDREAKEYIVQYKKSFQKAREGRCKRTEH